jgi:hypothetical protein
LLLVGRGVIWAVGAVREAGVASGRTAKGRSGMGVTAAAGIVAGGVRATPWDFGAVMEGNWEVGGTVEAEGAAGVVKGIGCEAKGDPGPVLGFTSPANGEVSGRSGVREAAGANWETGGMPAIRWVGGLAGGGVGANRPVDNLEESGAGVEVGPKVVPGERGAATEDGFNGCAEVEMNWEAGLEENAGAAGLTASGGWGVVGTGISR